MKKIQFTILAGLLFCQVKAQDSKLPAEFNVVAARAMETLSPTTRQWFTDIAGQHPPGHFDTAWAKNKIREKFSSQYAGMEELFMVMMEYLRMMNKEVREDRKIARQDQRLVQSAKAEKLKQENAKIDQQMEEAKEKANQTMDAASTSLWIGVVTGLVQAAPGITNNGNNSNQANQGPSKLRVNTAITEKKDSLKLKPDSTRPANPVVVSTRTKIETKPVTTLTPSQQQALNDAVKKLQGQLAELTKRGKI